MTENGRETRDEAQAAAFQSHLAWLNEQHAAFNEHRRKQARPSHDEEDLHDFAVGSEPPITASSSHEYVPTYRSLSFNEQDTVSVDELDFGDEPVVYRSIQMSEPSIGRQGSELQQSDAPDATWLRQARPPLVNRQRGFGTFPPNEGTWDPWQS